MPELPEVETTKNGILPHIVNQTITAVTVRQPKLRWPIPKNIQQKLLQTTITGVERRAKYLLIKTNQGTIILHLGMSGSIRILNQPMPPNKHDHIDLVFSNKKTLRFTDPRRFGAFLWTDENPTEHPLLINLGPEPLDKQFNGNYLWQTAQTKSLPVKSYIMDGKVVVGVGNIYATEVLFMAGIKPTASAKSISLPQYNKLASIIKLVLRKAIKKGGTTLKDFVNSDGKPGYFVNELKAYGRAGLPCVQCGEKLYAISIGQRNTTYCENCQR